MLIRRCGWHRGYFGFPLYLGLAERKGWRLRFTDGICRWCLRRFREEHKAFLKDGGAEVLRVQHGLRIGGR